MRTQQRIEGGNGCQGLKPALAVPSLLPLYTNPSGGSQMWGAGAYALSRDVRMAAGEFPLSPPMTCLSTLGSILRRRPLSGRLCR